MTALTTAVDASTAVSPRRDPVVVGSVLWLVVIGALALGGEAWPFVDDPHAIDPAAARRGPSWDHWFGTASFGQDVFSQVVIGARVSLFVAAVVTTVGVVVGGGLGVLAGFLRGWFDAGVGFVVDATLSIPSLLLVMFVVAIRGRSMGWVIAALCLLAVPAVARVSRAATLQVADRGHVDAARLMGASRLELVVREVLPAVVPTMVSFALLTAGLVLVAESSLSFLGLGVEAPTLTWGSIIAEGRIAFRDTPHMVFLPALVLFATVVALNLLGDRITIRRDGRTAWL